MPRVLLLVDIQKVYTTRDSPLFVEGNEVAIENMNRLTKAYAAAGDVIVYVWHQHKKDGSDGGRMFDYLGESGEPSFVEGTPDVEFDSRLEIVSPAQHIVKQRYSCFAGTGLTETLR
jgi:nicotinamidase-related amidase